MAKLSPPHLEPTDRYDIALCRDDGCDADLEGASDGMWVMWDEVRGDLEARDLKIERLEQAILKLLAGGDDD